MKKLFLTIAILAVAALAVASPFIVADPNPATKYQMRLSADNGVTWGPWTEGAAVSGAMRFDVGANPAGAYKGEAQAWGVTSSLTDSTTGVTTTVIGWSASAPFLLDLKIGKKIVNIKVIE
jgi:hypothetical protein